VEPRNLRGFLSVLLVGLVAGAVLLAPAAVAKSDVPRVLEVEFANDVNPVTQDYVDDAIDRAEREEFSAVVIVLDTPGGLSSSMRGMVKRILASTVPVVVYVAPSGASADSAGAVITMAADVAAMAPQTNIGSSTPISLGGEDISEDLRRKIVNDAAAYVGELAREHDRNARAAERMVTKASNYGATEALALGLVDVISPSVPTLLEQIDGRVTTPKGIELHTAGAEIVEVQMSFWKRALDFLVDPNVIALLLSIGLLGLVVELWNPGLIFPGTVGAISLLVGLYGLQVLPVSVGVVLLLLLAVGFWVAETFVPSHGALTVAGGGMFVIGALMLFDPAGDAYQVSLWTAVAIAVSLALLLGVALTRVVKARRNPVEVGVGTLVGEDAVVRDAGWVTLAGELWRARSADGTRLRPGDHVTVEAVDAELGLVVRSGNPTERPAP
jgi:membrane-bound serine protease (ClpP class)